VATTCTQVVRKEVLCNELRERFCGMKVLLNGIGERFCSIKVLLHSSKTKLATMKVLLNGTTGGFSAKAAYS